MMYESTRGSVAKMHAYIAIANGTTADGGLFVPEQVPRIKPSGFEKLMHMSYCERATAVLSMLLTDFNPEFLYQAVSQAYSPEKFSSAAPAPLQALDERTDVLELWHGPTCAFKDMALQLLPPLLKESAAEANPGQTTVVLAATSGDTGKAAMEGFAGQEKIRIMVFYPSGGVSPLQELQMTTQQGNNVFVCAVKGNFDDAQRAVKEILADQRIRARLAAKNMCFSSANSINWGRLAAQIVYYISAYCDLLADGRVALGDPINVAVPTGNFGNILAAHYAGRMGVPIRKLICASNANNVLTDFIKTGVYDRNRAFYHTLSPAMDILVSSNLERLLYDLTDHDGSRIRGWMNELSENGVYRIDETTRARLNSILYAGWSDDRRTLDTIANVWKARRYLLDPHTAVAQTVCQMFRRESGDGTHTLVVSTASPFKFAGSVVTALAGALPIGSEFDSIRRLSGMTGLEAPVQLTALEKVEPRFRGVCTPEMISTVLMQTLGV